MACDTYDMENARNLLDSKFIYFFGDSNMRGMYKDVVWLLESGKLLSDAMLKTKNEESHANDIRLSNDALHNGRNYQEIREYKRKGVLVKFEFITRLFLPDFIDTIRNLTRHPDILVLNSCVWDLTRWGTTDGDGVQQFKENLKKTLVFLQMNLQNTRIIWLSTLPPAFTSRGGFLTKESEFMRNMLPWHIMFANKYASEIAKSMKIDVLDLHYQLLPLLNYHAKDGIHWLPKTMRYNTNLLLTHIALVWNRRMPGKSSLDTKFLARSRKQLITDFQQDQVLNQLCQNLTPTMQMRLQNQSGQNYNKIKLRRELKPQWLQEESGQNNNNIKISTLTRPMKAKRRKSNRRNRFTNQEVASSNFNRLQDISVKIINYG